MPMPWQRDEVIKALLLLQEVEGSGLCCFVLQGQVHALMSAILFRVSRLDAPDVESGLTSTFGDS